ncbi:MAG: hypothetical protein ACYC3L_02240 [Gemmatimonadaceae bacterium]
MYATCLHCHADLGRNESVEHFQVGRRLAYDAQNGRFWVICPKCRRWNLTPLEERWNAIDECERLFERTRLRMSTANIGLARVADGTELVRVGAALRPEMAAWRYGRTFAARRQRAGIVAIGSVGLAVGWFAGAWMVGLPLIAASLGVDAWLYGAPGAMERVRGFPVPRPDGKKLVRVSLSHAREIRLSWEDDEPLIRVPRGMLERALVYRGDGARRVLPGLLAARNWKGAKSPVVESAVRMLVDVEAGERAVPTSDAVYRQLVEWRTSMNAPKGYEMAYLALEMALQEQRERELLAGELLDLELAWKEAEELARIADSLGSSAIDRALASLKARIGG